MESYITLQNPSLGCELCSDYIFYLLLLVIFKARYIEKYTVKIIHITVCILIHSPFCELTFVLPAPHKRLSRAGIRKVITWLSSVPDIWHSEHHTRHVVYCLFTAKNYIQYTSNIKVIQGGSNMTGTIYV